MYSLSISSHEKAKLAINGGTSVRSTMLPYGRQLVDELDCKEVMDVLQSDWLTTGPAVQTFEDGLKQTVQAKHSVAVCNGTAALHAAVNALGIEPGDEVIVPAISFVASANCVLYQGAKPVFADLCKDTLNIDPKGIERLINDKTKAIIAVDYAGHPCEHDELREIADRYGLVVVEDAAHALGASYKGRPVGALQECTIFSFHPVKHITTGEGGAIVTNNDEVAKKLRSFRHHGIDFDFKARNSANTWEYDVASLGFNYRIPDINCALGSSQLKKLPVWVERRREIAKSYQKALANLPMIELPQERLGCDSAWHLFVIRIRQETLNGQGRAEVFAALRAENIGVNVHYIPIPWMSHYEKLGYQKGNWPVAEGEYARLISLPIFASMTDRDVEDVVNALFKVWHAYRK